MMPRCLSILEMKAYYISNKDKSFHAFYSAAFKLWPWVEFYINRWKTDVIHESCIHPFSASQPVNHQTGSAINSQDNTNTQTHTHTGTITEGKSESAIHLMCIEFMQTAHRKAPAGTEPTAFLLPLQRLDSRYLKVFMFTFMVVSRVTPGLGDLINSICSIFSIKYSQVNLTVFDLFFFSLNIKSFWQPDTCLKFAYLFCLFWLFV